jgi:hypothetical protein
MQDYPDFLAFKNLPRAGNWMTVMRHLKAASTFYATDVILDSFVPLVNVIRDSHFSQPWAWNYESEVSIMASPDPGLGTATPSLLITVSING